MILTWFFVFSFVFSHCPEFIPSETCSDCLYPVSSLGAIKLPDAPVILMGGGSDSYGYLESNFKLLNYSTNIQTSFFTGANKPLQTNSYLEGFQSPIFCRYDSNIVFLDLSNDPPNMYELDMLTWSWVNVSFNGIPPPSRQRYAKTCTESKIYIHSGLTFKPLKDDLGFWEYDLKNKTWTVLPNVPFLWGHSIGVLGSDLIALGGNALENQVTVANTNIWKFDLNEYKWDMIHTTFYGGGTVTALNDSFIVYGGPTSSSLFEYLNKGWVLTRIYKKKDGWTFDFIDQDDSFKYARLGHTTVYDEDRNILVNLGGSDYQGISEDEPLRNYSFVSMFDLETLQFE